MFFEILKRDLVHRKSTNLIVLLFIIIASMFMASSASIFKSSTSSVDSFIEISNVPDYLIMMFEKESDEAKLIDWMDNSDLVDSYSKSDMFCLTNSEVVLEDGEDLDSSHTLFALSNPEEESVLYNQDDQRFELERGEIAIPISLKNENDLELGDMLTITHGSVSKEYKVAAFTKDAMFGSSLMGVTRMAFNEEDFEELYNATTVKNISMYYMQSSNKEEIGSEIAKLGITSIFDCDSSLIKTGYLMDALSAAILMIVSVCMLLISFFIMKFTITQTIVNDYPEIGVMKAIGMPSGAIRRIYLIKYMGLSFIGSFIGFILSIPFGNAILKSVSGNIISEKSSSAYLLNLVCSLLVIVIVLLYCYKCSGKIKKFSVVEAIRNGNTGERYRKNGILRLSHKKTKGVTFFLAGNDILNNLKRYLSLIFTFILGGLLFILPMNAVNTLSDDSLIDQFGLPQSDVYLSNETVFNSYFADSDRDKIDESMKQLSDEALENGIDVNFATIVAVATVVTGNDGDIRLINGSQGVNLDYSKYKYVTGTGPELANEIAITQKVSEYFDVSIGESLSVKVGDETAEYIVTGVFTSMNNFGFAIRFSDVCNLDYSCVNSIYGIVGDYKDSNLTSSKIEDYNDELADIFPDYEVMNTQDKLADTLGSIVDQFDNLRKIIIILVICINSLITVLMLRNFIIQEQGEIAVLKSIGFTSGRIRLRYTLRISILLVLSMAIAIGTSIFINKITIIQIFNYMGSTNMKLNIVWKDVYLKYPAIILVVTTFAAYLSTSVIRKISVKEINNVE